MRNRKADTPAHSPLSWADLRASCQQLPWTCHPSVPGRAKNTRGHGLMGMGRPPKSAPWIPDGTETGVRLAPLPVPRDPRQVAAPLSLRRATQNEHFNANIFRGSFQFQCATTLRNGDSLIHRQKVNFLLARKVKNFPQVTAVKLSWQHFF